MLEVLRGAELEPTVLADWSAFLAGHDKLAITVAPLEHGLYLTDPPLAVIAPHCTQFDGSMWTRTMPSPASESSTTS